MTSTSAADCAKNVEVPGNLDTLTLAGRGETCGMSSKAFLRTEFQQRSSSRSSITLFLNSRIEKKLNERIVGT